MKRYFVRFLCYVAKMVVLLGVVFVILSLTGTLNIESGQFVNTMFTSTRGLLLLGALLFLALVYPKVSFGTVDIRGDFEKEREDLTNALLSYGYSLSSEKDGVLVYRANSIGKRLLSQWCDAITVSVEGSYITLEGLKKDIARVDARFRALSNR